MTLTDLVNRAKSANSPGLVRLIAVDGGAGSGKSTLAERLGAELGCPIIQLDDFLSWSDLNGWWPRFESDLLAPLLKGQPGRYQVRDWEGDWEGDGLGDSKDIPVADTLIIEGVGSTRRAMADRLALNIWVEAPASLRLARGLERDSGLPNAEELWSKWMVMEEEFFEAEGCRAAADIIVDGTQPFPFDEPLANPMRTLAESAVLRFIGELKGESLARYQSANSVMFPDLDGIDEFLNFASVTEDLRDGIIRLWEEERTNDPSLTPEAFARANAAEFFSLNVDLD